MRALAHAFDLLQGGLLLTSPLHHFRQLLVGEHHIDRHALLFRHAFAPLPQPAEHLEFLRLEHLLVIHLGQPARPAPPLPAGGASRYSTQNVQNEFSPSATNSFLTASTRCERRNAFISAFRRATGSSLANEQFQLHAASYSKSVFQKNSRPLRGLLFFPSFVFASSRLRSRSAVWLRSSLAPPACSGQLRPLQLTDLGAGRSGTR